MRIVINRLIIWARVRRFEINRKWIYYRNTENEKFPIVNYIHVATRKLLFCSRFFRQPGDMKDIVPKPAESVQERYMQ